MSEFIKSSPYQALVTEQLRRFCVGVGEGYNPLTTGAFDLEYDFSERPYWARSLAQKPAAPMVLNIYEFVVNRARINLYIDFEFDLFGIEREIILDLENNEAVIERLYGIKGKENKTQLLYVATVVQNPGHRETKAGSLYLTQQFLEKKGLLGRIFARIEPGRLFEGVITSYSQRNLLIESALLPELINEDADDAQTEVS